jgi:putative aldouronate transport system permease protein
MPSVWKYIIVCFNAWKGVGYGSIVYLAAILGIDRAIFEAADIDGANIIQEIRSIILPSLKTTIIIMILMSIGGIFRGDFSMFFQMVGNNGLLFDATDVIDTFVFRSLMRSQEFGMSAAVGLYQSVLCFILIMATNFAIKKADPDSALF